MSAVIQVTETGYALAPRSETGSVISPTSSSTLPPPIRTAGIASLSDTSIRTFGGPVITYSSLSPIVTSIVPSISSSTSSTVSSASVASTELAEKVTEVGAAPARKSPVSDTVTGTVRRVPNRLTRVSRKRAGVPSGTDSASASIDTDGRSSSRIVPVADKGALAWLAFTKSLRLSVKDSVSSLIRSSISPPTT